MTKNRIQYAIFNIFGVGVALLALFPLFWLAIAGFKSNAEVLAIPFRFFPSHWDFSNYIDLFSDVKFPRSMLITFIGGAIFTILVLCVNSMSAYAFARLEFPFKNFLWVYVIMTMFIPGIAILIPSFIVVTKLGMLNSMSVLILPGVAGAGVLFFIRQFYLNIPSSVEEAALIDGASRFKIYFFIFLPLSAPPFVIMGVSAFLSYWNAFIWPVMTISDERLYQVMQLLAFYRSEQATKWSMVMAGATITAIPTLTIFLIFQKHIIQGIKISGLK